MASASKTGRVVIAQEAVGSYGPGSEIAAVIGRGAFGYLDMPIEQVALPFIPVPFSPALEDAVVPGEDQIMAAVRRVTAVSYRLSAASPAGGNDGV